MEGLVNYSSEDEQDEPTYHKKADVPLNRGERDGNARNHGRSSGNGNGASYKDETHDRHSSSSHHRDGERRDDRYGGGSSYSRENKDSRELRGRDSRDPRGRDTRDFDNGHKRQYDNRDHRSTHDRNYQRYGRDDYNRRERPRNEERYNNRHAATSSSSNNSSRSRFSTGNGTNNYDNSRSRYNNNQAAGPRRDEDRRERYSSASSRYENNRQQQNSNKYSSRNRRSRSRSRSKERRSPVNTKPAHEPRISPEREFHTEKSYETEQPDREIAPLMSLPLSDTAPRQPNVVAVSNSAVSAVATTVIQLPSYYNPSVINPTKYAEQVQKRKLLWGAKKSEETASKWGNAHFSQDTDGKVASKFMRLMGIKNAASSGAASSTSGSDSQEKVAPDVKSREAMFSSMEQQYEVARQVTHTMRGVGLGFGSSRPY